MMKRVLLWAGLVLLLLSLCACGNSSGEAIAWSEADWAAEEMPADDLPTIELTIGTLQQKANENRRAEVVCSSDFSEFSRETIQEDAACLTAEEVQMIEVVNEERYKSCTFSAEDALKDIDLFSRILRSSYGAYYLYEKTDWDAAADSMRDYIQNSTAKEFSTVELGSELLRAYSFVNDDHFRVNGRSAIAASNGYLYYNYLKDVYFWQDAQGYFTWKDDYKWYVTAINGGDSSDYMKPTITQEGELAYAVGTFLAEADPKDGAITLTRGDVSNTVSCYFTTARPLADKQELYELTQAGVYDGYYVMGVRGFPVIDCTAEEETSLRKYPETAAKLQGTSNFIIDSRGNGGGGDIWLEGLYKNLTGEDFQLTINELRRVSELTKRRTISGEPLGLYENKTDGSYAKNEHLFLYLIDKNVASAGERGICSILQMDNALLVGTNSQGCVLGGGGAYILPRTGICVNVGDTAFLEHNCTSEIEGLGWMPDIYVDGYLALDRAIAMYKYYGLMPDGNVASLDTWGETIRRFEDGGTGS